MSGSLAPIIDFEAGTWDIPKVSLEGIPDLSNGDWGNVSVPLSRPFAFRGVGYHNIVIRTPTGRDMDFYLLETDRSPRALLAMLSEAPPEIFEIMHADDYLACLTAAARLMNAK
ncbi:MAG: hypothetical protein C3F11_01635 [Methylocystaceae bacterium]|nr:MAG: hypothetical protein C3F11_01635 [Methylocystaceae bacterium]